MGLKYKVVAKRSPLAKNSQTLYYPALDDRKVANLDMVCEEISRVSTLTRADVMATVIALQETMLYLMEQGYNVKLDDLGTFSLHASAKGKERPEAVSYRDITKLNMKFLPTKEVKKAINQFQVRKRG